MSPKIITKNLCTSYPGGGRILHDINLQIPEHRITTIIGPNGCGKSTLLHSMANLIPIESGEVLLGGNNVHAMSRKELAQQLAVLPQSPSAPPGVRVADLVARGRHPHQSWLQQWSTHDDAAVTDALAAANISHLADRTVDSLSGGQRQRVWIALTLAQETDTLFLDEPTTYLDLAASIDVLNLVRQLNQEHGRTVLFVLHDLNLAIRYSDHLVIVKQGRIVTSGAPEEIITESVLQDTFGLAAVITTDPVTGGPLIVPKV